MTAKDNRPEDAAELRRRAEKISRDNAASEAEELTALSPEETRRMLHELRVHQIELEMQNEELLRAQVELEETRARYFDLYDLAPVGYITVSETGLILETNLTAATLLGVVRSALVKQPITRFILPDDQDIYYRHRRQLFETGQPQVFELRMVKPDGRAFWARLESTAAQDEGGAPACRVVISDITTEHGLAEDERERLLSAVEQVGEPVLITHPDGTISYVNPAFETVTGYSRKEVIGKNSRILKSGKQEAAFYRDLWGTISAGRTWKGRMVNKRKDGSLYTEEMTISPVRTADGRIVSYVAVKRDITDHLRLTDQLQQARKMESVGQLAGGVAHDYNNMLTVILGFAQLALDKVDPAEPLHADLLEIIKAAERSVEVTRQLLAFARKQTVTPRVLDLNEIVESMLRMLRRVIGEDIDLAWLPGGNLWPVKVDPTQIDQILANLCVNARHAIGGGGGKVTIETRITVFDEASCAGYSGCTPGEYVRLSVSDTGCGMDKETLAHIFEPFFTTRDVGEGTGLGLATVYGIVKQNNGFIDVCSESGRGTTFSIYLPRHVDNGVPGCKEAPVEPTGIGNETILLVEDEPAILKVTKMMFERLGYTVLAASTPSEAMHLAKTHSGEIHLLLTDVFMPGMNGRDLARDLLSLHPDLKLLFMSGHEASIIAPHGMIEKGLHFIKKPFSRQALAAKAREALGKG
ncbi:MAG: PAS domain S-box protein [Pseudomonadota bacterium]